MKKILYSFIEKLFYVNKREAKQEGKFPTLIHIDGTTYNLDFFSEYREREIKCSWSPEGQEYIMNENKKNQSFYYDSWIKLKEALLKSDVNVISVFNYLKNSGISDNRITREINQLLSIQH